jgi:hypothetical protein
MTKLARAFVCEECAREKANQIEDCPHAVEIWNDGYRRALQERPRARLTSDEVQRALGGLSASWQNFYHLAADILNRILDEKDRAPQVNR